MSSGDASRQSTPWLLATMSLLSGLLPAYVVLAGPLKSNGYPPFMICLVFFVLALTGFIAVRRSAPLPTVNPGVLFLLIYFFLNLLIYGMGITHTDGMEVDVNKGRALITLVAFTGMPLYVMMRVKNIREKRIVLGCVAVGLTFSCFVAILQNAASVDLALLFRPPGFDLNLVDLGRGAVGASSERFGSVRATGTAGHAIELGVVGAVTVPLNLFFARRGSNKAVRSCGWVGALIALLAVPASVSRSGILALIAALLFTMWIAKIRTLAAGFITIIASLLIYKGIFPTKFEAISMSITNASDDSSITDRINAYAKVSETLHKFPIFGLGLGGSPPSVYGYLDNQWLQAIAQGGITGAVSMIILSLGTIFGIAAALRVAADSIERDLAYTMGGMVLAILLTSVTFDLFSFRQITLTFFLLFGLLWSGYKITLPPVISQPQFQRLPVTSPGNTSVSTAVANIIP